MLYQHFLTELEKRSYYQQAEPQPQPAKESAVKTVAKTVGTVAAIGGASRLAQHAGAGLKAGINSAKSKAQELGTAAESTASRISAAVRNRLKEK